MRGPNETSRSTAQNAMYVSNAKSKQTSGQQNKQPKGKKTIATKDDSKMKCYKCNLIGHRAESANKLDESLLAVPSLLTEEAILASNTASSRDWCLDSGCTSHMCKNAESFVEMNRSVGKLNLASTACTEIGGKGHRVDDG